MFPTRHEILAAFHNPELTQHAMYPAGVRTFSCLNDWEQPAVIELPKLHIDIGKIDYLEYVPLLRSAARRCSFTFSRIVSVSGFRWMEAASFRIFPEIHSEPPDRDFWASWSGASAILPAPEGNLRMLSGIFFAPAVPHRPVLVEFVH